MFFLQIKNIDEIPHGPFDVVTLIDVIHNVTPSEQKKLLTSCIERVRPGGLFIYKDMADRPLWKNLFNRLHYLIFSQQLIHYVPLEKIIEWATDSCMKLISEKYYSRFGYAHELLVFRKH